MTIPARTRLDNAALIYPPCKSEKYATAFRMSVTLTEIINPAVLQESLETILRRFPSFTYTIGKSFFWWYLKRLEGVPHVKPSRAPGHFDFEKNGGFMFRIGYDGCRIDLDVFHALTDGTGAMTFLMSLAAEYICRRHNLPQVSGQWILDSTDEPSEEEFEDSFDHFSGIRGALDKEEKAYHMKGTALPFNEIGRTRVSVPVSQIKEAAKAKGCTVTELMTALMLSCIQEERAEEISAKSPFIRVEVPVNLRPIFRRRTLRNFSSYMHLGIDVRNGNLPFEEIIHEVQLQKKLYSQPRRLTTRVAANVALEDNKAIGLIPRFIKKPIMKFIFKLKGESYTSTTLSNLGEISLPPEISKYISGTDFILGRPYENTGSCACVSYGGRLVLNFTRKIAEDRFENLIIAKMRELGLSPCVIKEYCTPHRIRTEHILSEYPV